MNINKRLVVVISVFCVLGIVLGQTAPPPSVQTPEEKLWAQLRWSAQRSMTSAGTRTLMKKFLAKFPKHPRSINVRYMQAERQFHLKNYKGAAVSWEAFLRDHEIHPLADSAAFRLGECYYNMKVYNSAYTAWERLITNYRDSALIPEALTFLSIIHMKKREWGQADERMKELQAKYPHYLKIAPHRENYGIILYHLGDYTGASQVLEGIERQKGSYYRGLSLFALKLYEGAVVSMKVMEFSKGGPYVESAAFLKAESYFQQKNYSLAITEFKTYMKRFPKSGLFPHAKLRDAACSLLINKPGKALLAANQVLELRTDPEVRAYAWFIRGSALLDMRHYGPAADSYGKIINDKKRPALAAAGLVRKAWAHKSLGHISSAGKSLQMVAEKHASSRDMPLAHFLQGAQMFQKKSWEEAGSHLEAGLIRHKYSVLSEAALAMMAISFTRAKRTDQLVTSANATLKILEGNYSSASPYWRAQSHYYVGKAYYDLKNYKDAIPFFEKVVINYSDQPLSPAAQLFLAWCYVERGQSGKALELVAGLLEHPKASKELKVHAEFLRGTSSFNAKKYDKAIAFFVDFVKAHPKHELAPEALYFVGMSYHQKGIYGSAIEEWTRLINSYSWHSLSKEAYLQIGDIYFKAEKYENSAKFFKKFHTRWPSDEKYGEIAMWQEIQSYFNGKLDERAIKAYPKYIEKYPSAENIEDAKKQLEMVYYRRGSHGDPAKLQEFLSLYPQSPFAPTARYKLGTMAIEQEKWTLVAEHMELFIRDFPKDASVSDAQFALAQAYEKLKEWEKAINHYETMMKKYDGKKPAIDAAFRLGMIHYNHEKFQEAVTAFNYAVSQKLEKAVKANLLYNIGLCYENLGKAVEAAGAYSRFARYSKNLEQIRVALLSAGSLYRKAEQFKNAVKQLTLYLKDPGDSEGALQAVNLVAESYKALGKTQKFVEAYERLVSMDPASNELRLTGLAQLAYHYEQAKQFNEAIRIYEKIAISGGKDAWVQAARQRVGALTQNLNQLP